MTVIACFVMFRVDLCVTSSSMVTIVVIRMLILDVCVSKQKSSSQFFKIVRIAVISHTVQCKGYSPQY